MKRKKEHSPRIILRVRVTMSYNEKFEVNKNRSVVLEVVPLAVLATALASRVPRIWPINEPTEYQLFSDLLDSILLNLHSNSTG